MKRCILLTLIALAVLTAFTENGFSGVDGIIERFSGDGEFATIRGDLQGLENADWDYFGDATFADGGLRIVNEPINDPGQEPGFEIDEFVRFIDGAGSFIARLELRDADLGEFVDLESDSAVSLCFDLAPSGGAGDAFCVRVFMPPNFSGDWRFGMLGDLATNVFGQVRAGPDIALQVVFDHDESRVSYSVDNNLDDNTPPVNVAAAKYLGDVDPNQHRVHLRFAARALGSVSGLLTLFSEQGVSDVVGDFNGNEVLDVADINLLSAAVRSGEHNLYFDLTGDSHVDENDRGFWVHDLKNTFFGDANLNGEFNTADLVIVFQAGEYEDATPRNSTWATGDWSGDGEFTTGDLVLAFQEGGYEAGPPVGNQAVPEPSTIALLALTILGMSTKCRMH